MASRPIDEKIVRMKLENQDFKAKSEETLGIFAKINSTFAKVTGINFGKAHNDLSDLNRAAGKVDMSTLAHGVETVTAKFSALGAVGFTVFQNLTNKAIDAGAKIANALGMDGAKTGFNEYELKLNATQTIMASTGEDLATVNKYLKELNDYSDTTVYSFRDMTSNIGKFTNAGIKLEDAVLAIQGISNEAAISGANAQEASQAMYNLSQAMSSGSVRLLDWKSIENANMATKEFKEQLIQTALEMGTVEAVGDGMYRTLTTDNAGNISDAFNSTQKFNEALSNQWMTSEVLVETLKKYSDRTTDIGARAFAAAQDIKTFTQMMDTTREAIASGWAESWEIIVGDYNEAKALWTGIAAQLSKVVATSTDARNNMLRAFKAGGGFKNLAAGLGNVLQPLGVILKALGRAYREIFPKKSIDGVVKVTENFKNLTEKLRISEEGALKITKVFGGFFSILNGAKNVLQIVWKLFEKLVPDTLGDDLLAIASRFGELLYFIGDFISDIDFEGFLYSLGDGFEWIGDKIGAAVTWIKDIFGGSIDTAVEKIRHFNDTPMTNPFDKIAESSAFQKVKGFIEGIGKGFQNAKLGVAKFAQKLREVFTGFKNPLKGITMSDMLGGSFLAGTGIVVFKIVQILGKVNELMKEPKKWSKALQELTSDIGDAIKNLTKKTKAEELKTLAIAIAILTASLVVLSWVDGVKIARALGVVGISLSALMITLAILNKIKLKDFNSDINKTLIRLGVTVFLFAAAIKKLSGMSPEEIKYGTIAIAAMSVLMVVLAKMFQKAPKGNQASADQTKQMFLSLIGLVLVVKAVTSSVKKLGNMKPDALLRGVAGTVAILGVLIGAFVLLGKAKLPSLKDMMAFMKFSSGLAKSAMAMLVFSLSLRFLVKTIEGIGQIDPKILTVGLIGLGVMLAEVAGFQRLAGGQGSIEAGIGIAIVAASIGLLVKPLTQLGALPMDQLYRGLWSIALVLSAMSIALVVAKNTFSGAAAILVVTASLMALVPVIMLLGNMPALKLIKALGAIAWGLTMISLALILANKTLSGGAALILAAVAINLLVVPLKVLSTIPLGPMLIALLGIAGAMAIISIGANLMIPLIPGMFLMAAAFAAIGVAGVIIGAGLLIAGIGLGILGTTAVLSVTSIISAGSLLLDAFNDLIPKMGDTIYRFIVTICDVIKKSAPEISDVAGTLIVSFLEGIVKYLPNILALGVSIVIILIMGFAEYYPMFVQAAMDGIILLVTSLAETIKTRGPELVQSVIGLVGEIVALIVEALIAIMDIFVGWIPGLSGVLGKVSDSATSYIRDRFDGETLGGKMTKDMAKGIKTNTKAVKDAAKDVSNSADEGYRDTNTVKRGRESAQGFNEGISLESLRAKMAGMDLVKNLKKGILGTDTETLGKESGLGYSKGLDTTQLMAKLSGTGLLENVTDGLLSGDLGDLGIDAGIDYSEGVGDAKDKAKQSGVELGKAALAGAKSISGYETGQYFGQGYINGIISKKYDAAQAAKGLGTASLYSLKNTIQERSPSKLTKRSGKFFGEGFIIGIRGQISETRSTAIEMAKTALDSMNSFINQFADSFIPEQEEGYEFRLKPILDLTNMDKPEDQSINLNPDLSRANMELSRVATSFRQNGSKNNDLRDALASGKVQINEKKDLNITITGADALMDDPSFVDKIKTVILNEVVTGNRSLPNRVSLIQL